MGITAGLAFDPEGHLWVTDFGNSRIEEWGEDGECMATIRGAGAGQFTNPIAIAFSGGSLYVADYSNDRVDVRSAAGEWSYFGNSDSLSGRGESRRAATCTSPRKATTASTNTVHRDR